MNPLRIDIELCSPMVEPSSPLHLDALLAWAAVAEATANGDEEPLVAQETLPLERDLGVWCASALSFEVLAPPSMRFCTKRTDVPDIAQAVANGLIASAPNKFDINRGPWRQSLYFFTVQHAITASAWCIGDAERIAALLDRVRYLGARRRNGHGKIARISVTHDDDAHARWRERVLPEQQEGYLPLMATTAPPYWDRTRQVAAWAHPAIV